MNGERNLKLDFLENWTKEHEAAINEFKFSLRLLKQNPLSVVGLVIMAGFLFIAIAAPIISPYDPLAMNYEARLLPPGGAHWLGTDEHGRDVLSRIFYGASISLTTGAMVMGIAVSIGVLVGSFAGYIGGRVDELFMRITDIFLAFPSLILAMAVAAALGRSLTNTMLAIAFTTWPDFARLMRGQTLRVKQELFVEAARSLGASKKRIVLRHVIPNCLAPIIVQASLGLGGVIIAAAGLSFIGFGAQPPAPEWGVMISSGRQYIMNQWWLSTFPGLAIFTVVLGINFLGDGLRDILDPRLRRG